MGKRESERKSRRNDDEVDGAGGDDSDGGEDWLESIKCLFN